MKILTGELSNKTRAVAVLTVLALLAAVLGAATAAYRGGQSVNGGGGDPYLYSVLESGSQSPAQAGGEPDGCGVLVLGKDYDSNRTDAIICVYFDYDTGGISTLQIPRDTYIKDGDYAGRINTLLPRYREAAASAGSADPLDTGIHSLMAKLTEDFGVPLDGYIFIDSTAVEAITDAVGGVTLDIPTDIAYTDTARGIDLHLKEGTQRLNGAQAAQFIRYRQGYPQADIGRINAQKLYAAAMLDKLMGFSSVTAAISVVSALAAYIKTDLTADEAALLATKLFLAEAEQVVMYTLPGNGVAVNGASYYGTYADKLAVILANGFAAQAAVPRVADFSADGGYADTEGVRLSSVLAHGISIPVYAGKN